MEIFLYELDSKSGNRKLIGVGDYILSSGLRHIYGEEEDKEYKIKWNKNFYLDKL